MTLSQNMSEVARECEHAAHRLRRLADIAYDMGKLLIEAEDALSDIADDDGSIADLRRRINEAVARAKGEES